MDRKSSWVVVLGIVTLVGCGAPPSQDLRRGQARTAIPTPGEPGPSVSASAAWRDAQQVFAGRCVVCHGCYDAPCQLSLGTFEGIERGASKVEVYDGARLLAIAPTRLGIDAHGADAWRARGFHPVLAGADHPDPAQSLLVRMLALKRQNPLPVSAQLPDDVEVGLDRRQECPRPDEFDHFAARHPLWGMPYALPGVSEREHAQLVHWASVGAPHDPEPALAPALADAVDHWERFLNQPSKKARLMARYLYEHLFLASLVFDEADAGTFFRIIRAREPFGPPTEVPTRRPFDDPGPAPFYYRIVRREGPPLAKTHMPYAFNEARLARYRSLFLEAPYTVDELPSYHPQTSANPFATFAAIPVGSRYRFLLDEAHFSIDTFIKGPVCRGQIAVNVIDERFWITFANPDSPILDGEADLLARALPNLGLPAEQGSNNLLVTWRRYARQERAFVKAKSDYLSSLAKSPALVNLDQVWAGDGTNDNAGLTVFRHFDNASVVKGLVGGPPKTAWVVGFALLERIHYLLVAGFDVFGNVGHQLQTRMYMDFLRMEAEHNFLLLLPKARRRSVVDQWYRDVSPELKSHVYGAAAGFAQETGIAYETKVPERELYARLKAHLAAVDRRERDLESEDDVGLRTSLARLAEVNGKPASLMPEASVLEVREPSGQSRYFTLLRESAHTNVAHLFHEQDRRRESEDRLTVVRGFLGAYPNALFVVERSRLDALIDDVRALDGTAAYAALRTAHSVRRSNPDFWTYSDRIQAAHRAVETGLLDYNRLDEH